MTYEELRKRLDEIGDLQSSYINKGQVFADALARQEKDKISGGNMNRERKYLLDDNPVSFRELIKEAESYDESFAHADIKSTSHAAQILRRNGFTVSEAS